MSDITFLYCILPDILFPIMSFINQVTLNYLTLSNVFIDTSLWKLTKVKIRLASNLSDKKDNIDMYFKLATN